MKLILLLLSLLAVVFAQQQHIDTTVVTVAEDIEATSEHFLISIDHIEDVFEDNKIVAERDVRVALRFDVGQDTFTVNDAPVQIGYNELTVMAQVYEVEAEGTKRPFDELVQVSLRVYVGYRQVQLEDGTIADGIFMQERVTGVQSTELWQAEVIEQVFVFRKDGSVARKEAVKVEILQGEPQTDLADTGIAEPAVDPLPVDAEKPEHDDDDDDDEDSDNWFDQEKHKLEGEVSDCLSKLKAFYHEAAHWFHNLPFYLRVLVAFGGGVVLGLVVIGFLKCLGRCICGKRQPKNKTTTNNYKENIRVYSLQYTAVPQDEKDAKKKEEGSIEMV